MFIKPCNYKSLSPKVSKMTDIKIEDLKYGFLFNKVMKNFRKWLGKEYILCTWSKSDIVEFKRNCEYHHLRIDWMDKYIDVQYKNGNT